MKVKLTLARAGGERVDVVVTAEPSTSVGEIARELHNADPTRRDAVAGAGALTLRLHAADGAGAGLLDAAAPLIDSGLASGAVVSLAAPSAAGATGAAATAAVLTAVSGPQAGHRWNVPVGSSVIGRDPSSRVHIDDPLVSKAHARLNVTDAAEILDIGSANGTLVNGRPIDRAILRAGDVVTLGDTGFTVDVVAHAAGLEQGGTVHFNRAPRLDPVFEPVVVKAPEVPERPTTPRIPYLALVAPLLLGVVMFVISPTNVLSIVMIAVSPLLVAFGVIDNILTNRRTWKRVEKEFREAVDGLHTGVGLLHDTERASRLREIPGAADAAQAATERSRLLWTRRPEHESFLHVRLGVGEMPSRVALELPGQRKGPAELWTLLTELAKETSSVEGVPVVEAFRTSGSIGVAGPLDASRAVARGVIAQLVGLHSPAELAVHAVASMSSSDAWDWLKWLPHVGSPFSPVPGPALAVDGPAATALLAELETLVAARRAAQGAEKIAPVPAIVLLVEDDAPADRARLVALAEQGPEAGVHLLWVAGSIARVPAACRTYVEIDLVGGTNAGFVHTGQAVEPVEIETVDASAALAFARSLSPVADAGARVDDASDLPRSVSLLGLMGSELARESEAVIERWGETNSILTGPRASAAIGKVKPNLRAVFGQAATEPFVLDLRSDGPHALVGGTTGSGKSEFLQAWVLGMAAAHSPQRVSFLFVDYKGGAAFADCVDLPHTVGLVTDLSPHLVRRALTSLRAELHYRERLFQRHKVKDIIEFERTGSSEVPPSLVIVVDEFAALATEVPEFVDGVVDVAQRGRSLGLHLILATQRPAGVIRDNLRANTNLRVALRMADEADSDDVLGSSMAAAFDPSLPGRGAAKTGPGRIRVFQSGYAGGWTSDDAEPSLIVVEELAFGAGQRWESPVDPGVEARAAQIAEGPTDIQRLVSSVKRAAEVAEIPSPRKPWLPVLAPRYDLSKLPNRRTDVELVLGVTDDATAQAQPTVSYVPDRDGNMAIIGTGGSGKSTAMRSLAVSAALTARGGPVHVYGLDFGSGGLSMLQSLPHVGAVISGDDDERVARLLRWLRDLVDDRAVRFAAARAGDIVEYRKNAGRPDEPRILLLLDGMGAFRETYEANISSPWFSVFSQIATDGRQVGVHVVVSGDRAGSIPTSLASSIQRRLVLRLANADDYGMLGVEADILDATSPAGRGILDGQETQIAVLGGDGNIAVQSRKLEELAAAMTSAGIAAAAPVERLAEQVALADVIGRTGGDAAIGLADDTLQPVGIEVNGAFVIAGPPSSGRTTAVATLASSLAARGDLKLYLVSSRRSPLSRLDFWTAAADSVDDVDELVTELAASLDAADPAPQSIALFIENIAEFAGSSAEYELERVVKVLLRTEQFVVGEGETSTWSQAYTLGQPLRAGRKGLLLQPDDGDGDLLLNTALPRIKRGSLPQGRGFLVARGRSRKVQVAAP